jgi:hypothetical protein
MLRPVEGFRGNPPAWFKNSNDPNDAMFSAP